MPFSIQTKYAENKYKKGDVVCIRPDGFEYFEGDCFSKWLEAGRTPESWRGNFIVTYCTDEDMDGTETEVQKLLESYGDENSLYQRKYYLDVPADYDDPNRVELRETGETSATWEVINNLIIERTE